MDNPVLFVCKDPGGMNGIIPVYDTWVKDGGHAVLIANGKAVELLPQRGIAFRYYPTPEAVLAEIGIPAALVTSMCSQGGIGRDLVPILRGKCPTVALQDFWGGALRTSWEGVAFRPDHIVVNDAIGLDIVRRAWPDVPPDRVAVLGYPALDRYAGMDVAAIGARVRTELGVTPDEPVVLFAGQLHHSGAMLAEVARAIAAIGQPVCLIPRTHPRMRDDAPDEAARWDAVMAQPFAYGRRIVDTDQWSTAELIAASTVVVSMFSTVLIEAASVRRPTIAVLYPDAGMARFLQAAGGIMPEFPLVELGCCAKAVDQSTLEAAIRAALDGSFTVRLRPAQERAFRLDGRNAERVVSFVRSLIVS